jgi:hypothetical protein
MATKENKRCDVRVWSFDCKHDDTSSLSDKYLCSQCGTLGDLQHEVRHDFFSYVSGDYQNLS